MHELRVIAAVDLHINMQQHPALKSVYGKSQPVIGGKLFSFYFIGKCLPGISRGTEKNKKNSRIFFHKNMKMCHQPLPLLNLFFFSGIAHSKTIHLNWSYKALTQKEAY